MLSIQNDCSSELANRREQTECSRFVDGLWLKYSQRANEDPMTVRPTFRSRCLLAPEEAKQHSGWVSAEFDSGFDLEARLLGPMTPAFPPLV
jgi:hypothetical protein